MKTRLSPKVALVWHGDRETRQTVDLAEHRLRFVAEALRSEGLAPEAAVYNDDFADEVLEQLLQADAVLVWVNPIENGRSRTKLDAMLAKVADSGVLVSADPRTIQKMGTKSVLVDTKDMSWGSDVHVYNSLQELQEQLPARLAKGKPRVLKQHRGHSGTGVWKVTPDGASVKARHALRGSVEQVMSFEELFTTFEPYFEGDGRMIDQAYQERLEDGMIRCYLVQDRVAGFGHQAINALYPGSDPGPRLYHPPTKPDFQAIRSRMEGEWLPEMMRTLSVSHAELPLLWDADFFFGPGEDSYVLCEVNVSSVFPFPDDAIVPLAKATRAAVEAR